MNIDVRELISLVNKHPRVNVLNPGCGVGGHCISVDPWFIVDSAGGKAKLIEQARRTNDYKADWVIEEIKKSVSNYESQYGRSPRIACMGLTFKPDIDDLRESPALYIALKLSSLFDDVFAVEPNIDRHAVLKIVSLKQGLDVDMFIYLVKHKEFLGRNIQENDMDFCGIS